jgi:DNA-binding response OmpR family regulator
MKFQALLVLNNDVAAEVLTHVLSDFGFESESCSDRGAAARQFDEKRFDAVIVDFDDPAAAAQVLQRLRQSSSSKNAVTVGLLSNPSNVRSAFGMGANFVLYRPISSEQAHATLRAAQALLKRERRRKFRVPVQLPVTLSWEDVPEVEGIMLDLSEDGMDVLSAQPLQAGQVIDIQFSLSDSTLIAVQGRVAWANTNGQAGVQFTRFPENQHGTLCTWLRTNAPEPPPEEPEPLSQCKLSDLSLGGCYVETESPFPRLTRINLCLRAGTLEVNVEGLVRVMHPGHGMGIEFSSRTSSEREQVERFIDFLTSQSDVLPRLLVAPKSLDFEDRNSPMEEADPEDSLLQLLRREQEMSQDEFLTELRRQRRSESAATTA